MSDKPEGAAVWRQGENQVVGTAFVLGIIVAALAYGRYGWGAGSAGALWGLTWFGLWYVLALLQVFTRAMLMSAAAVALVGQGAWKTEGR